MENPEVELFVEVCEGFHRRVPPDIIKSSNLPSWQKKHQESINGLFSSIYLYSSADPQMGPVISPLYFDFDNEQAPSKAQREAIVTINSLMQTYDVAEESITICFSGLKGFSVTINPKVFGAEASELLPLIWKNIAKELPLSSN